MKQMNPPASIHPLKKPLRNQTLLQLLFTLLASLALAQPLAARELPYKGRAAGAVVASRIFAQPLVGGGGFLSERGEAVGNFAHVGRARVWLEWVVRLDLHEGELVYLLEGTFGMTAANGDTMAGIFWARQLASDSAYVIEVTVQGGTGRFVRAAGVIRGTGARFGDQFRYALDGVIDLGRK